MTDFAGKASGKFPTSEVGEAPSPAPALRYEVGRYLFVPYEERKEAGRLGAIFDPVKKAWYVPAGRPTDPFAKWFDAPKALSQQEIEDEFANFCESMGLVLDGPPVMDGNWHAVTVSTSSDTKAKKGAYKAENLPGMRPSGFAKNHDTGEGRPWSLSQHISEQDRESNRVLIEENQRRREAETAAEFDKVAQRSAAKWRRFQEVDEQHAYLVRKGVGAHGLRQDGDKLVTALRDPAGKIWSLQFIDSEGGKKYEFGGAKTGKFHVLGDLSVGKTVLFGEGYATCASLREATGLPVVEVFDGGNIEAVIKVLGPQLEGREKLICGDDDVLTHARIVETLNKQIASDFAKKKLVLPRIEPSEVIIDGASRKLIANPDCTIRLEYQLSPEGVQRVVGEIRNDKFAERVGVKIVNLGREKALAAAIKHGGKVVFPVFHSLEGRPTDFNDLHMREGLSSVRKQIGRAMMLARPEVPQAQATALDVARAAIGTAAVVQTAHGNGRYVGVVVGNTGAQAVQNVGRSTAVAHDLDKLDRVPTVGQPARIAYTSGIGRVASMPERDKLEISR
jgi:putative DNA primase/helicase